MNIKIAIQNSSFLKGFSEESCEAIADIGKIRELKKKEILFLEGDSGNCFFLCLKGNIQLSKSTGEGKEIVINVIKEGVFFAEVILFENNIYPVTASAITNSTVLMLKKDDFYNLLDKKSFRNEFLKMLFKKQQYLAERIKYLTIHDVEDRLFHFFGQHYGDKTEIDIDISKKDIAAAVGTTPETLSRLFQRLTDESKLRIEGNRIFILKRNS